MIGLSHARYGEYLLKEGRASRCVFTGDIMIYVGGTMSIFWRVGKV